MKGVCGCYKPDPSFKCPSCEAIENRDDRVSCHDCGVKKDVGTWCGCKWPVNMMCNCIQNCTSCR